MPGNHAHPVLLALALALAAPAARAQEPTVPADPPPAGSPETIPEKIDPRPPIDARTDESRTEPLDRSHGVIRPPPAIDPEMVAPPPDAGAAVGPVLEPPPPPPDP